MAKKVEIIVFILLLAACNCYAGVDDWSAFGHFANRNSIAVDGPDVIDSGTLSWIAWEDPCFPSRPIEFEWQSTPIVYDGKVLVSAKYLDGSYAYTNNRIIAFEANSGAVEWIAMMEAGGNDSWSSPCIDTKHDLVLMGSGYKVYAIDIQTGTIVWETLLDKQVVNASVCVALDIPYARAFITDYSGAGSNKEGKLYCINLDPNVPENPYEPGEIVWSSQIGATSGNSPAYIDGVVYVASRLGIQNSNGTIYAFDAAAEPNYIKLWEVTDSNFEGFLGGVNVTREGFLYAANYDFYGEGALTKVDCNTGQIVWITQTERTDSIPVVVGDRIYVTGGIEGYGSMPKLIAFEDQGVTVSKLWETSASAMIGGWTNQPVYANGKLYIGAMQSGASFFTAYTDLYVLDVQLTEADPDFVIDHYYGCGSSPAVTYDSIYSLGNGGLHKFYQPALLGDIEKNNSIDMQDLNRFSIDWLSEDAVGIKRTDSNLDGYVDFMDFALLAKDWRENLN